MHPFNPALLSLALAGALASPAAAAMHEQGPLGVSAEGAPTPDAADLSKMRLPEKATPTPVVYRPPVKAAAAPTRMTRAHARWLQMEALSSRIDGRERLGKLDGAKAGQCRAELLRLQTVYQFHSEDQGQDLSPSRSKRLRLELNALERQVEDPAASAKR